MTDPVERLVNLAFYLAHAREPVSAERIRADVAGYPTDQDTDAFLRMFERDKDTLRESGLAIVADESGSYCIDRAATFSAHIELTTEEAAAVRAVGTAFLDDPSFPLVNNLQLALAKIASAIDSGDVASAARLADEDPGRQGTFVAALIDATQRRKRVSFTYTNSHEVRGPREIEPYGLFLHDGRWYVVGRDMARSQTRTYTVARMSDIETNAHAPKSPDFERPSDFDVTHFSQFAFQYGDVGEEFEAVIRLDPSAAWRVDALASGRGRQERQSDGSIVWHVTARDQNRLLRFVIENGPGLCLAEPPEAIAALRAGLTKVAEIHGP